MSFREITVKKPDNDCRLDAPEWKCCQPCPPPCRQKCCPKTRVWDAIDVFRDEYAQKFEIQRLVEGGKAMVAAHRHCIELTIRERGFCDVLVIIEPVRSDIEGNVWFEWPNEFSEAKAGYYEADLKIDGELCTTLCLRKVGCWTNAKLISREFNRVCPDTCVEDDCCEGTRPSPDLDDNFVGDGCNVHC